ncbi:hypothetical protein HG535_0C04150 [Zygotorulaspora mrakii]|uniref:Serine/threonine-protein kinase RIO1 n=1 Tax=Zygotorulaspora mrakii TaxID=42260 RepID=A0A7H9B0B6_ZYGMR|nr:uncharacterized protein HG535_0C04150 [Zygotorulaspora mrakii]QLG72061.1 hypothetical protein HG535_0C04150 [Zygotorulaspora mrakii]
MSLDEDFDKLRLNSQYSEHGDIRLLEKHEHKIKTDEISISRGKTTKDKANRATVENVLDPRTMGFLRGLMNRGVLSDFNGCLSTGKEANVYHAFSGLKEGMDSSLRREYAIKIYKTSILVFKDRERYVDGEFRFRKSRSQHNPRKMIKIWAEKEFRNLRRIYQSDVVPGPEPIEVRNNVLVMEFLSRGNGFASPKLRDYPYKDRDDIYHYYYTMIAYIRLLYQICRLVHADLSEYNAIVHNEKLYIIDVSQSVEPEHPMSLDFLRMDIKNINLYFEKLGIDVFPERLIFQFVISEELESFGGDYRSSDDLSLYVSKTLPVKSGSKDSEEDEVFRSLYLIRNLGGLEERDFERFTDGKFDLLKSLIAHDNEKNYKDEEIGENIPDGDVSAGDDSEEDEEDGHTSLDSEDEQDESDDESANDSDYTDDDDSKKPKGKKFENKEDKKQRKQETKDAKREKRKTKVKKHIKKKMLKKTKSKK